MKNFKILNTVKEMQVTFYLRYCRREMEIIVTGLPPPRKIIILGVASMRV